MSDAGRPGPAEPPIVPARPPADDRRDDRAALAALAVAWAALVPLFWFGLFVASMRPDAPAGIAIDLRGYFLPKYVYAAAELGHGRLPLWNPWELAGVPFLGAGQPAVLYPPRVVLFGLLRPLAALHAFMLAHYLWLGVGAFALLRTLGCRPPGAALGALAVTFQPFMLQGHYAPHWISNFCWVPFVLAAFVRTMERPGLLPALALAVSAALLVLAGYPEYAFDTALVVALLWPFTAARAARAGGAARAVRGTALAAGAAATAALVTAPHWAALLETVRTSVRAAGEFQFMFGMQFDLAALGADPRAWVTALGLLVALPPLAWAALAAGLAVRGRPYRPALVLLAALAATATSPLLRDVPPFAMFRGPLCWVSILELPLAALAGFGLDALLATLARPGASRAPLGAAAAAALACVPLVGLRSLAWLAAGGAALAAVRLVPAAARAAAAVAVATALGWLWTWVPASLPAGLPHRYAGGVPPYATVAEAERRGADLVRACGESGGRVLAPVETWEGVPLLARVAAVQGYPESLAPARTSRLLDAAGLAPHTVFPLDWDRLARASEILRLLDVRCVVVPPGEARAVAALGYALRGRLRDGRMALVREGAAAFVAEAAEAVADERAAFAAVTSPAFTARRVVLEGRAAATAGGRVERVEPHAPGRERWRVTAEGAGGGWLVVSAGWYPGWRARIDGRPAPVERADYALLAVHVPRGAHDVELRYVPRGFGAALAAFAAGAGVVAVALVALGVGHVRRSRRVA
ncbi:MAG TPA: YfhO family protein [Candidatus Binatia bacterium]|nr:YfhO family protein [Candidatus Binatia bacterium]